MTIQNLIDQFSGHPFIILGYFVFMFLGSIISVKIVNDNNFKYMKYILSGLVHAVTIPGILAALLILYALLIIGNNILEVSIISYFVPLAAMVATLYIIHRKVPMKLIPGFKKLSGLIIMITIVFVIVFVLQRTQFGVLFLGSLPQLAIIVIVLLVIIKVAWNRLTKKR